MNRELSSLHEESLEITLSAPLTEKILISINLFSRIGYDGALLEVQVNIIFYHYYQTLHSY